LGVTLALSCRHRIIFRRIWDVRGGRHRKRSRTCCRTHGRLHHFAPTRRANWSTSILLILGPGTRMAGTLVSKVDCRVRSRARADSKLIHVYIRQGYERVQCRFRRNQPTAFHSPAYVSLLRREPLFDPLQSGSTTMKKTVEIRASVCAPRRRSFARLPSIIVASDAKHGLGRSVLREDVCGTRENRSYRFRGVQ
jgi:hypothetical protein